MALQINTTLTTDSGFTVASGAYVNFEIRVKPGYEYSFFLNVYKDETAFDNGERRISVIEFDTVENGIFTASEITYLAAALAFLQAMLIDKLETKLGQTNVITEV